MGQNGIHLLRYFRKRPISLDPDVVEPLHGKVFLRLMNGAGIGSDFRRLVQRLPGGRIIVSVELNPLRRQQRFCLVTGFHAARYR